MADIFTQFLRRGMPERAQKDFAMESSRDIVGSYLLCPDINGYERASSKTHEVLSLQTTGKANIDVTAQVEEHTLLGVGAISMCLRSELGSIRLRLVRFSSSCRECD